MTLRFGKYEMLGLIGSGGMGSVYLARDVVLDRHIALKVLEPQLQNDPQVVGRFLHEARVSAGLAHPNIVVLHDFGKEGQAPFIAMEYLSGETLKTYLEQRFPLTLGQKLHIALQVARGLEYAHARVVVHRDIKPGNIQILPTGDVKLMDFGIAKVASMDLTQTGMMIGTPGYASPEQAQSHSITPASDVFSFGVVLYELLAHRKPFEADNPMSLLFKIVFSEPEPFRAEDAVPAPLADLVMACLAKSAEARLPSMGPVLQRLRQIHKSLILGPDGEDGPWLTGRHDVSPIHSDSLVRGAGPASGSGGASTPRQTPGVLVNASTVPLATSEFSDAPVVADAFPGLGEIGLIPAASASSAAAPGTPGSPGHNTAIAPSGPAFPPGVSQPAPPWAWPQSNDPAGASAPPSAGASSQDPAHEHRAAAEAPEAVGVTSGFLGGPIGFEMQRLVQGEMARSEFDFFNSEVRRVAKSIGHVNSVGRSFEWNEVDREGNRLFCARIAPRAGLTLIHVEESFQPAARVLFGGFFGGLGGVGLGVAMAIGMGLFHSVAIAAIIWAQVVLVAYLLARYFYVSRVRSRTFQLKQLLERLADHVQRTAVPAGTPGNQPYRPTRLRVRN